MNSSPVKFRDKRNGFVEIKLNPSRFLLSFIIQLNKTILNEMI